MKFIKLNFLLLLLLTTTFTNQLKAQTLKEIIDKVSYAIGLDIAKSLTESGLDSLNVEQISTAMNDYFEGKPTQIEVSETKKVINDFFALKSKLESQATIEKGKKFLEENKTKEGVITLPSGLQYIVMKEGEGDKPTLTSKVTTHYHGTLMDGTVFDSSVQRNKPASFPVNGVIKGWTEALQLMNVGSKWKLFLPYDLAYGERGAGSSIGPYETLIFEVELLGIE
jgi:FKBP-type peptidyl-prolyl cis-trans isomerase FklB